MATKIRAELSKKNKYYLSKKRYFELKYFCLQYPDWKKAYARIDGLRSKPDDISMLDKKLGNPTEKAAFARVYFSNRIEMLDKTARHTDKDLGSYILLGITEGISYETVRARTNIPCCRDQYYHLYRKFFWLLDKIRQ